MLLTPGTRSFDIVHVRFGGPIIGCRVLPRSGESRHHARGTKRRLKGKLRDGLVEPVCGYSFDGSGIVNVQGVVSDPQVFNSGFLSFLSDYAGSSKIPDLRQHMHTFATGTWNGPEVEFEQDSN